MGLRELGAHDPVGGVLELVPLVELRLDAQPVERAAHEGGLDADAEHAQVPAGLEPDLVERGREHVAGHRAGPLVERLGPRQGRLAAGREGEHGQPQLLHRRPGQRAADLGDQPDDASVVGGLVQGPQGRAEPVTAAGAQPGQRVVRPVAHGQVREVELEEDPSPNAWHLHVSTVRREPPPVARRRRAFRAPRRAVDRQQPVRPGTPGRQGVVNIQGRRLAAGVA